MGWWLAAAALKRKIYARDVIPTQPRLVDVVAPEKKLLVYQIQVFGATVKILSQSGNRFHLPTCCASLFYFFTPQLRSFESGPTFGASVA